MAFVVEDGTGLSTANSYLSDTDADTYFADHGAPATWTGTAAVKQEALRMATQYLDAVYGSRWKGRRRLSTQSLDWPRINAVDNDDYAIAFDALPQELQDATSEAALRHLTETGGLLPDVDTSSSNIKSERVKVGPIEEEIAYTGSKHKFKKFSIIDAILDPLVFGSAAWGEVVRS